MAEGQRLTAEQKRFAVQCFACCMTPQQVADAVKEEFQITVQRSHIIHYNGDRNEKLKKDLRELFEKTRKEFCEEANKHTAWFLGYRLGRLQRMSERAEQRGNFVLAAQLIEQIAKDVGGLYTNRREHSGPNGGAIPISVEDKCRQAVEQMLKKQLDKGVSVEEARASLIALGVDERDIPTISVS